MGESCHALPPSKKIARQGLPLTRCLVGFPSFPLSASKELSIFGGV